MQSYPPWARGTTLRITKTETKDGEPMAFVNCVYSDSDGWVPVRFLAPAFIDVQPMQGEEQ